MESAEAKAGAPPEGPQAIMNMFQAAQSTALLCSAIELNVFEQLAGGAGDAAAIARAIRCPERAPEQRERGADRSRLAERARRDAKVGGAARRRQEPGDV